MSASEATLSDAAVGATVNADNPWPGLLAFRESDRGYFQGRQAETEELFRLAMRERLTVLLGLSGLGKSSLLQAGLFPRLRRENLFPVYIRLDFSSAQPDLVAQVCATIAKEASVHEIEAPLRRNDETLWEYFHREANSFWNVRNKLVVPLLVFDQFEEIFTLGHIDPDRSKATEAFLDQLADLSECRPSTTLKEWIDDHPDEAGAFDFERHHYKLLLGIREDFLPDLEALRARMPTLALNRFRLRRMNGEAALLVVNQAQHLIDPDVGEQVVRFVSAAERHLPLVDLEVEPALLSVVCRELNNRRLTVGEAKISAALLQGNQEEVLADFYGRSTADLAPEVRSFIEDRLLTVSGYRDSVALENALSTPGVSRNAIDSLVERRLVRREDRGGTQRLELTHDLLTGVVCTSRDRRRQQEEAEKARIQLLEEQQRKQLLSDQQLENEKKERERRELKRTRRVAVIFGLLSIAAVAGLFETIHSRTEIRNNAREAYSQRLRAEMALNRIRESQLIRQATLSGDQKKLNEVLSELVQNNKIQFAATATDLHYPDRGFEVYKFELFPQQATLPTGEDKVAFVTYLADSPAFENTLFVAGEKRGFRVFYIGWGCLNRIVALTEYAEPTKSPMVTVFDMCKLLGDDWQQGRYRKANSP